jgi:hypothetical protein
VLTALVSPVLHKLKKTAEILIWVGLCPMLDFKQLPASFKWSKQPSLCLCTNDWNTKYSFTDAIKGSPMDKGGWECPKLYSSGLCQPSLRAC